MKRGVGFVLVFSLVASSAACGGDAASSDAVSTSDATDRDAGELDLSSSGDDPYVCLPGEQRCSESGGIESCDDSGLGWTESPCQRYESCIVCVGDDDPLCEGLDVRCSGPCDPGLDNASSRGCSFVTVWMPRDLEITQVPQVVEVSNPDSEREASVQLLEIPMGEREEYPYGEPVTLAPGERHRFELPFLELLSTTSLLRTGSLWRISSDLPVTAHQFAPYDLDSSLNFGGSGGGTLLLPEDAFLGDFVAVSRHRKFAPTVSESYFIVVALEDETTVAWEPPMPTVGNGLPVPPAMAGERVEVTLNRYDWVRVHASAEDPDFPLPDVSGTVIESNAPVAAFAGVPCGYVPTESPWGADCDHMQEQLLPLNFWGQEYVLPHPPVRGPGDAFALRIYAAGAGTVSETTGTGLGPWTFAARGEWVEVLVDASQFAAGEAGLVLTGDTAFMPVIYLRSAALAGGTQVLSTGDPAMTQVLPTAQYLSRQSVATPETFFENHIQLLRPAGGAAIRADGSEVEGWTSVGDYETTSLVVGPASVVILDSEGAFGVLRYGFMGSEAEPVNGAAYAGIGSLGFEELTTP